MNHGTIKKLVLLSSLLLIAGCGNKTKSKVSLEDAVKGLKVIEGVGFQEVFDEVLSKNCLECHSTYSNYQVVAKQSDRFLENILSGRMPKNRATLSGRQKSLFKSWVDAGSPKVANEVSRPIVLAPTYESLFVNVFAPKCLACHSGRTDAPGPVDLNFATYDDMIKSNELYAETRGFGDRFMDEDEGEDSPLISFVSGDSDPLMPPLKLKDNDEYNANPLPQLTEEEVAALTTWIEEGFPDN